MVSTDERDTSSAMVSPYSEPDITDGDRSELFLPEDHEPLRATPTLSSQEASETTQLLIATASSTASTSVKKDKKFKKKVVTKLGKSPSSAGSKSSPPSGGNENPVSPVRKPYVPDRTTQMYHRLKLYRAISNLDGNTMIGSSMLMVPWGFGESGLYPAVILTLVVGMYCYYTSRLIVVHGKGYQDFADLCQKYLGRLSWYIALISSIIVMTGAIIAYDTLLSNSLYSIVVAVLVWTGASDGKIHPNVHETGWQPLWAAVVIFLIVFPLSNIRKTVYIVRIASFGLIFVLIVMAFVLQRSFEYLTPETIRDAEALDWNFGRLAGMLAVSFFIHNAVLPIMSNAKNPEKNVRDHAIGFVLVIVSYLIMGIMPFLAGQIVMQNFMEIYVDPKDIWAFVARVALFLQLTSVLPLLVSIVRTHILGIFSNTGAVFKWHTVFAVNFFVLAAATVITILFPNSPGTVLGYVGSVIGSIYVCALPILVHLRALQRRKKLKRINLVFHIFLMVFGVFLFVNQYFIHSSVCLHNCTSHGFCVQGTCHCNSSFVGDDCSIVLTE